MSFFEFIYCGSYIVMGVIILTYIPEKTRFRFAKTLKYLGWFGVLYGVSEALQGWAYVYSIKSLKIFYFFLLTASLIFLYVFGVKILKFEYGEKKFFKFISLFFPFLWFALILLLLWGTDFEEFLKGSEIYARILLCFTGSIFAFFGFIKEARHFKMKKLEKFIMDLKLSAYSILLNGIFCGLFYTTAQGQPVFLGAVPIGKGETHLNTVRIFITVLVCFFILRILKLFKWEKERIQEQYIADIKNERKIYREIFDGLIFPVFLIGKEGRISYCNRVVFTLTGKRREEIFNKKIDDFFQVKGKDSFFEEMIKNFEKKRAFTSKVFLNSGDISRPLLSTTVPFLNRGFLIACQDLTPVKNLLKKLQKTNEKISREVKKKTRELETVNRKLKEKLNELERWQKVIFGREEKILKLKDRVKELEKKLNERQN